MPNNPQPVFIISDSTGIAAEKIANSLLTQFPNRDFAITTIPYVEDALKAEQVLKQVELAHQVTGCQPIIFSTLVNTHLRSIIERSDAILMDFFAVFITQLEQHLGTASSHVAGGLHGLTDKNYDQYTTRIDALNYTMECDDGINNHRYDQADVIIIGPSRSGKTPTCLYLALQFGIFAANYPLTDDDNFAHLQLPNSLRPHASKLFGLTISTQRLQQIRQQRRPNSQYSARRQCQLEINACEQLYRRENIATLGSTELSIEELATKILEKLSIERRLR